MGGMAAGVLPHLEAVVLAMEGLEPRTSVKAALLWQIELL